jgi:transcriptional regulator with XRE-family HTH domain
MTEPTAPDSVSELLTHLRRARRADERMLKEIAKTVGVTLQAVQRWETGKDQPGVERMAKWLRAVGFPVEWAELYDRELIPLDKLDRLMERYEIEADRQHGIRVLFRDGLRRTAARGVPKKARATGSSR